MNSDNSDDIDINNNENKLNIYDNEFESDNEIKYKCIICT